jgi:hypothetical protein
VFLIFWDVQGDFVVFSRQLEWCLGLVVPINIPFAYIAIVLQQGQ